MRLSIIIVCLFLINACSKPVDPELLKAAKFDYPDSAPVNCASGELPGKAGSTDDNKTASGARYNLRTPSNYKETFAHPLIVVYAPAGINSRRSERYVHLTKEATSAGFIIAYANNIQLSLKAIDRLSSVPSDIQKNWCIDSSRVYYTGHSDGGSISNALTFLPSAVTKPTAIAPSASGIDGESLKAYDCPPPLPVMVFHNTNDTHFEGFGKQSADWWASCNQCSSELAEVDKNGCRAYKGCPSKDSQTYYCEGPGSHADWPNKNHVIIDFFNKKY